MFTKLKSNATFMPLERAEFGLEKDFLEKDSNGSQHVFF